MKTLFEKLSILILSSMLFLFCKADNTAPNEKIPVLITVVSGENQPGDDGKKLEAPIVVKVSDPENNPLANVRMTFSVIGGGGTVDNNSVRSDSEGFASSYWTLGNGDDHILKVSVTDDVYSTEAVYVFAQTEIDIDYSWIRNVSFPQLFGRAVIHDNRILETNHYLVFSDASSDDAKIRFAKMAEEMLFEVFQVFGIQSGEEVGIRESNKYTKPTIFTNVRTSFPYGAFAFRSGYICPAFDSQTYLQFSDYLRSIHRLDLKHETVHLIQFLVGLDNLPNLWPDVWFSEGLAVLISNNRPPVATIQEMNEWRQIPGNENPITIKDFNNYPTYGRRWYYMFGTAVKYLLDEKGHGKTFTDVLEMFRYMASSRRGFAHAFEIYMGISVQYYEDNFWDLITKYLE